MDKQELMVFTDNFKDVGIEMTEMVFDSIFTDGFLKEIPVINLVVSGFKAGKQIKDILYMKKLAAFIYGYVSMPARMDVKIEDAIDNADKRRDLGYKILLIIDNVDSTAKANLVGKVFGLFKSGEITSATFLRICHMINKSYYDYLFFLTKFTDDDMVLTSCNDIMEETILEELFTSGWLSELGFDGGNVSGKNSGTRYGLNSYGKIIIRILT